MKKISGWLFVATICLMLVINACERTGIVYHINQNKCNLCKKCVPVCGYHAISMVTSEFDRDTIVIDPNKCVGCGECKIVCPVDAITSASSQKHGDENDE